MEKKLLEERLLKEIIEELNRRQRVPVTFYDIDIEMKAEGVLEGSLSCSEPRRTWKIPLQVEIKNDKVYWNANETDWYSFTL